MECFGESVHHIYKTIQKNHQSARKHNQSRFIDTSRGYQYHHTERVTDIDTHTDSLSSESSMQVSYWFENKWKRYSAYGGCLCISLLFILGRLYWGRRYIHKMVLKSPKNVEVFMYTWIGRETSHMLNIMDFHHFNTSHSRLLLNMIAYDLDTIISLKLNMKRSMKKTYYMIYGQVEHH